MENIILIGMPGSGKSTVGVLLAKSLGYRFLDSDLVIQEREGKLLHEADIKIGNALRVTGSPTWIVNGKHKFSGLDAETIRANFCKHNAGFKGCENTLSKSSTPVQGGCGN